MATTQEDLANRRSVLPPDVYQNLQQQFAGLAAAPTAPAESVQYQGTNGKPVQQERPMMGRTLGEMFFYSIPDAIERESTMDYLKDCLIKQNAIVATDLDSLLTANMSEPFAEARNTDTRWFNFLESRPRRMIITDRRIRIPQKAQGTNRRAALFHPDGPMPAEAQKTRTERSQTLMFFGEQSKLSIVGQSMLQSQMNINLQADELEGNMLALRQAANYYTLRGVEESDWTDPTTPTIPQSRGVHTGSTTNPQDLAGNDMNDDNLEDALYDLHPVFGEGFQAILFTNKKQIKNIKTLEINKYPGNSYIDYLQYEQLKNQFNSYQVKIERLFEPTVGNYLPVVSEKDLPSGESLLAIVDYPYLGEFALNGSVGAMALALPTALMYDVKVIFYGCAPIDPMPESRRKIINHP